MAKQPKASAEEVKSNETLKAANADLSEANKVAQQPAPEKPLITQDGTKLYLRNDEEDTYVELVHDDNSFYTLEQLNELEKPGTDWKQRAVDAEKLIGKMSADMRGLLQERDDWKLRAEKHKHQVDKLKATIPLDSMGLPKVIE